MSIIIINRARVRKQLEVIDDPITGVYDKLLPEQKDQVEVIRNKSPKETVIEDWKVLLEICQTLK